MHNKLISLVAIALFTGALTACTTPAPTPAPALVEPSATTPAEPSATALPSATAQPSLTFTAAPSATATITLTPEPRDYGPDDFPANVNPLTGLPVTDPSRLERRPIGVKIQMFPRGQRPPWGISLADIVWDYYQNNGLTRLHALFYGNDAEQIGPVRSARLLDSDIIRMYKSLFAFGGADKRILEQMFSTEYTNRLIVEGFQDCPPMCRIDPNGFNYLVTNSKQLTDYLRSQNVENGRQNLNGMSFQHAAPAGGNPATQLFARYSISAYTRWDYDAASGRYLRFQDTQEDQGQGEAFAPLTDRLNDQHISAANVVVLYVPHEFTVRSGGSEIVDIRLEGSGQAYIFRDGQAYSVFWNRPAADSVLYLTRPDGSAFPFKPGNTWFQVVGVSSRLSQPAPGVWRFVWGSP